MTTQEYLIRRKMGLLELAEYLKNVSEACRVTGVSRQHFYDIRKAFAEGSYETINSRIQPGGGEMMLDAAVRLLKELAEKTD